MIFSGVTMDSELYCDSIRYLEIIEVVDKLRAKCSRPDVIDVLMDGAAYTKNGRLNRSALCRLCGLSGTQLNVLLAEFQGLVSE